MSKLKNRRLLIFIIALVMVCAVIVAIFNMTFTKPANADVSLSGDDDTFELTDETYGADEAFVFTATVNFEKGQAAGLAFGADSEHMWVFNIDRQTNAVKLMYFDYSTGAKAVRVLENEYYIGPSNMNEGERQYFTDRYNAKRGVSKTYLKVVVTPAEEGKVFAEFYADGIRRFAYTDGSAEAHIINLNDYKKSDEEGAPALVYAGGKVGYNCFNADIIFTDIQIGESDYTYYSEAYRNRYHFSQFSRWNNDPNGLVYYKGYYHLYYQNNPYGNTWDDMHWGHARSKDLVHWEMMPVALVPDYDLPEGEGKLMGAMWSGSVRVYHKGDSAVIDGIADDWFGDISGHTEGTAEGLIGFYSWWNGNGGNRYQVVMFSKDGGLTWNKRNNINRDKVYENVDKSKVTIGGSWRDPKVFKLSEYISGDTGEYKWGMALTNMEDNVLYFLKSKDILNWEHAGAYTVYRPECPDVISLSGHTVITFTSRYYVVCDLTIEDGNIVMYDLDGKKIENLKRNDPLYHSQGMNTDDPRLKKMEYGVDSYASQTFYIDADSDSAYKGKAVSMSWFSGVPNVAESIESGVLQNARKVWNGGGMTIPVVFALSGQTLTATPITLDGGFDDLKTNLVEVKNKMLSGDPLSSVSGHSLEIYANISNPTEKPVSIKVNKSADGSHYTEIGWNRSEGYFVDRTYTDDGGIDYAKENRFGGYNNYAIRYASGMGKRNSSLEFYILVDSNNVEVYCDGFTVPFYILTFAAPSSKYASLTAEGDITLRKLTVNSISSVWREDNAVSTLLLSETSVSLDDKLTKEKKITAEAEGEVVWSIASGEDCVQITPTGDGVIVKALKAGSAILRATCGTVTKTVEVTVHTGSIESDLTIEADGIVSGNWYYSGNTLVGEEADGDGFILLNERRSDFVYTAGFDLGSGAAAALVFRAEAADGKLTSYLIANYDNNGHMVKLWSQNGEIKRADDITPENIHDIKLSVDVSGRSVKVAIDGVMVIDATLGANEPTEGRFGLNICATKATFKYVSVTSHEIEYTNGDLKIEMAEPQYVVKVTNRTLNNTEVNREFLSVDGSDLIIRADYMAILPATGMYVFTVKGEKLSFDATVNVKAIPEFTVQPVTITEGADAVLYIGNLVVGIVYVNNTAIATSLYKVSDRMLTIKGSAFKVGINEVEFGEVKVNVTVNELPTEELAPNQFTVSFEANLPVNIAEKIENMPQKLIVDLDGCVVRPKSPTLEGYIFGGWYSDSECNTEYDFATPVTATLKIYAKWTKIRTEFDVTFSANIPAGCTAQATGIPAKQVISIGSKIVKPEPPELEGYLFIDWYVDAEGTARFNFDNEIRSDIALFAKWLSLDTEYTVTYDINIPENCTAQAAGAPAAVNVKFGLTVEAPEAPTLAGYVFVNWCTDAECTTKYVFGTKVYSNITLYANWKDENTTYKFTFNANVPANLTIEAQGVSAPLDVKVGQAVAEPEAPTLEGFAFVAWCSDVTCRYKYNFATAIYEDTQIYARWAILPVTHSVTYDGNAPEGLTATNIPVTRTVRDGKTTAEPTKIPRLKGYTFEGWYAERECVTPYDFESEITADIVLYAKWTEIPKPVKYKLSYSANLPEGMEGTPANMPEDEELSEGGVYLEPLTVPTFKGYTFGGWFTDAECTTLFDFFGNAYSDVTVYAKWTKNPPDYMLIFGILIPALVVAADAAWLSYVIVTRKLKKRTAEIDELIAEAEKEISEEKGKEDK